MSIAMWISAIFNPTPNLKRAEHLYLCGVQRGDQVKLDGVTIKAAGQDVPDGSILPRRHMEVHFNLSAFHHWLEGPNVLAVDADNARGRGAFDLLRRGDSRGRPFSVEVTANSSEPTLCKVG